MYYMCFFCFFKQKTAYEMRISDWSSDVCSSDLALRYRRNERVAQQNADLSGRAVLRRKLLLRRNDLYPGRPLSFLTGAPRIGGSIGRLFAWMVPVEIGRVSCRERVCQ